MEKDVKENNLNETGIEGTWISIRQKTDTIEQEDDIIRQRTLGFMTDYERANEECTPRLPRLEALKEEFENEFRKRMKYRRESSYRSKFIARYQINQRVWR
ncbi:hypothetical protein RCL_jg15545.t1 [Rhizophagus clarus]|uniref:Uncharacterized protein n=1 Tax=Rhizophagus clarus TaxID=94130 RepID=A0A8H3KNH1_9GLOM|nr:hypothetical protein RCL_jg15545.t1 [Rhizophagus clarus]